MKKNFSIMALLSFLSVTLFSSCEVIGDIFKAGVWVGILVVVGVIALVIYLISRLGGRK
jgi:hypothetical protein